MACVTNLLSCSENLPAWVKTGTLTPVSNPEPATYAPEIDTDTIMVRELGDHALYEYDGDFPEKRIWVRGKHGGLIAVPVSEAKCLNGEDGKLRWVHDKPKNAETDRRHRDAMETERRLDRVLDERDALHKERDVLHKQNVMLEKMLGEAYDAVDRVSDSARRNGVQMALNECVAKDRFDMARHIYGIGYSNWKDVFRDECRKFSEALARWIDG